MALRQFNLCSVSQAYKLIRYIAIKILVQKQINIYVVSCQECLNYSKGSSKFAVNCVGVDSLFDFLN